MVVYEFQKNAGEVVRFSSTNYKGHDLLDIRAYFEDESGTWRPTKKGITVSVELIDDFVDGVRRLKEHLADKSESGPSTHYQNKKTLPSGTG